MQIIPGQWKLYFLFYRLSISAIILLGQLKTVSAFVLALSAIDPTPLGSVPILAFDPMLFAQDVQRVWQALATSTQKLTELSKSVLILVPHPYNSNLPNEDLTLTEVRELSSYLFIMSPFVIAHLTYV